MTNLGVKNSFVEWVVGDVLICMDTRLVGFYFGIGDGCILGFYEVKNFLVVGLCFYELGVGFGIRTWGGEKFSENHCHLV